MRIKTVTTLVLLHLAGTASAQTPRILTPAFNEIGELGEGSWAPEAESPDGRLLIFGGENGWTLFDRGTGRTRAIGGVGIELAWSPRGDQIAFVRPDDRSDWLHVWTQGIDPRTGQLRGLPRRIAQHAGRAPAWSPDGQSIAFSALPSTDTIAPRIVIVSARGGAERVLVQAAGFAQNLTWSPDGQSIFYRFKGRPLVPRVFALNRVSVRDGSVHTVKTVSQVLKGTGSGKFLAYGPLDDALPQPEVAVSTVDGLEVGRFALQQDMQVGSWSTRGLKLLAMKSHTPLAISVAPISGGPPRVLSKGDSHDYVPAWSDDSRQIAVFTQIGKRSQLAIKNAATGVMRHIPTRALPAGGLPMWSPDQRYIAFYSDGMQQLNVVEIASGVESVIARSTQALGAATWGRDSRGMIVAVAGESRTEIREFAIGGTSTLLRQIPRPLRSVQLAFAADSVLLYGDETTLRVLPLRGGAERVLVAAGDSASGGWNPFGIALSRDGAFVAISKGEGGAQAARFTLHLLGVDGRTRRAVTVNGLVLLGQGFRWHPDGRHVAHVAELAGGPAALYLIPVNGDSPRALVPIRGFFGTFDLAPDGSAIAFSSGTASIASLWEIDLTRSLAPFTTAGNGR